MKRGRRVKRERPNGLSLFVCNRFYESARLVAKVKVDILALTAKSTKIKPAKRIAATTACCAAYTGVAKLVVALAFLLIFKDFVGFAGFFKLRLVATFFVGVKFNGGFSIRLFNLIGAGAFWHTEYFVIISFGHI